MNAIEALIAEYFPHVDKSDYSLGFGEVGIDSFDLVEFRVVIEHKLKTKFPDSEWTTFETLQGLAAYFDVKP